MIQVVTKLSPTAFYGEIIEERFLHMVVPLPSPPLIAILTNLDIKASTVIFVKIPSSLETVTIICKWVRLVSMLGPAMVLLQLI